MRRTLTWHFDLPADRLWPVLADTNRFNEAMGLPPYSLEETPQPDGTVLRRGAGKAAGYTLEWEEKPYEWILNRYFRQARVFTKGPFRRFGPVFEIVPEGHRSKVSYTLEWEPLTWVARLFGQRLARKAGEAVEKRMLQAAAFVKGERPTMFDLAPPELPAGARERASALAEAIDRTPYGNGLGRRLTDHVLTGMATDLMHLRPKSLAREFEVAPRLAIEACLAAVRAGL
ncbi:MAG TPA: SRPBCC family protein, partial [Reyranella sp.]|nr:SRPBCC family protein [Reyranella sp.]